MTQVPFRHLIGNLAFTFDGAVWAIWQVDPAHYLYAPTEEKLRIQRGIASVLRTLRGEPLLLSLCGQVDPVDTVERTVADVDLTAYPLAAEIAEATLDAVGEIDLRERTHWLALPLPALSRHGAVAAAASAAAADIGRAFGISPPPISDREVTARVRQARKLASTFATAGTFRPATPDEILWIHRRAARRGGDEPLLSQAAGQARAASTPRHGRLSGPSLAGIAEVHLDEGGRAPAAAEANPATGVLGRLLGAAPGKDTRSPFAHRYVRVSTEHGVSYQAFLTVSQLPEQWVFPGAEWLAGLDQQPFPVDWAVRLRVVPGREAEARTRRKQRDLAAQVEEYDDDDGAGTPNHVFAAHDSLAEERTRLQANAAEVELQALVVMAVYGDTEEECEDRANALQTVFNDDFGVIRPTGHQISCYQAMLPGLTATRHLSDLTQYLLADDLAKAMPWSSVKLGDGQGHLFGFGRDSGSPTPVLLNMASWATADESPSIGLFGALGSGKSVTQKKLLAEHGATGARTISWDRTESREYVNFTQTVFGADCQVVDVATDAAQWSLDPLRVLPGKAGEDAAAAFLTLQLQLAPMSPEGVLLSELLEEVGRRPDRTLNAVQVAAEARKAGDPVAKNLAGMLAAVARKRMARVIFDPDLPALDLHARHIVFATHGVKLPTRHELRSDFQLARLPFEKTFGMALLYITAAIGRAIAFANPAEFALLVFDELWWLTGMGEGPGYELVLECIRDGRKHAAGLIVASHDPADVGSPTLLGLLGGIIVMRQPSKDLAGKYVDALGVSDPADVELLVKTITGELSPLTHVHPITGNAMVEPGREGECIARLHNRIGMLKVVIPPLARIDTAIRTTPGGPNRGAA